MWSHCVRLHTLNCTELELAVLYDCVELHDCA